VDRNTNDNFKLNQETEFVPILGQVADQLNAESSNNEDTPSKPEKSGGASDISGSHHSALLELLASELSVKATEIHDFEL
jgi:aspartyl aminopeptidase